MITLTEDLYKKIESINWQVNQLPYKTDMELYGKEDFWTIMGSAGGDCEDYALTKRNRLATELGLDPLYMLPAVGRTIPGDLSTGHCVLMLETDKGGYVLDNNNNWVLPWKDDRVSIKQWLFRADPNNNRWVTM